MRVLLYIRGDSNEFRMSVISSVKKVSEDLDSLVITKSDNAQVRLPMSNVVKIEVLPDKER